MNSFRTFTLSPTVGEPFEVIVNTDPHALSKKLATATSNHASEDIEQLLKEGANPYELCVCNEGQATNALHRALAYNHAMLEKFLKYPTTSAQTLNQPSFLSTLDGRNYTYLIHGAIDSIFVHEVADLLDTNMIDLNKSNRDGYSPLRFALYRKNWFAVANILNRINSISSLADKNLLLNELLDERYTQFFENKHLVDSRFWPSIERTCLATLHAKGLLLNNPDKKGNNAAHQIIRYINTCSSILQAFRATNLVTAFEHNNGISFSKKVEGKNIDELAVSCWLASRLDFACNTLAFAIAHGSNIFTVYPGSDHHALECAARWGSAKAIKIIIQKCNKDDLGKELPTAIINARTRSCLSNLIPSCDMLLDDHGKKTINAYANLIKKNGTKDAIRVMRRYLITKHIMSKKIHSDIAHIIAQYDSCHMLDEYVPTREEMEREKIVH